MMASSSRSSRTRPILPARAGWGHVPRHVPGRFRGRRLRQVILHRPGLELKRLTPSNKDALLFDDVLWVSRAPAEHDAFADVLRDRGVEVHLFGELLPRPADPRGPRLVLDSVFDERVYGPMAIDALRASFDAMDVETSSTT